MRRSIVTRNRAFAIASAIVATLVAFGAAADCLPPAIVTFDDGTIGPYYTPSANCGSVGVSAGQLVLAKPNCAGSAAIVMTGYTLCGDFDVSVDFSLTNFSVPPTGSRWTGIYIRTLSGAIYAAAQRYNQNWGAACMAAENYHFYTTYADVCNSATTQIVPRGDAVGKLRIERIGTRLNFYYWESGHWVRALSRTVSTDEVRCNLGTASDGATAQEVRFDNLRFTTPVSDCVPSALVTFDDGSFGQYLVPYTETGAVSVASGQLVLSKPAAVGGSSASTIGAGYVLCGDFDISVDYDLVDFAVPPSNSRWAGLYLHTLGGSVYAAAQRYNQNWGASCMATENLMFYVTAADTCNSATTHIMPYGDTSGRLRMERIGGELRFYYWQTADWVLAMTRAVSAEVVRFGIGAASDSPTAQTVRFDNLNVVMITPPSIGSISVANLSLEHTDSFVKNDDSIRIAATVSDPADDLSMDGIRADLSPFGGSTSAPPGVFEGGVATWTVDHVQCVPANGSVVVVVSATDALGTRVTGNSSITADNVPPAPLVGLRAEPGCGVVHLNWTSAYNADPREYRGVVIRYAKRNGYPAYPGPVPAYPTNAADGDGAAVEVATNLGAGTHLVPGGSDRGIYFYSGFVYDEAMNYSPVSGVHSAAATNYWLGDVCGNAPGDTLYNGVVDVADLSVLGAAYGSSPLDWPLNEADVGPTIGDSQYGVPSPDGAVDFEDLMIFALNLGVVGPVKAGAYIASSPALSWRREGAGLWSLWLDGPCPALKGLRVAAELPGGGRAVVQGGELLSGQGGPVFLKNIDGHGLDTGLALMGPGGFEGSGELLRVTLPADVQALNLRIEVRGQRNEDLGGVVELPEATPPAAFLLEQNHPNPFNPATNVRFGVPTASHVRLTVYDLSGRIVRVLFNEDRPAGFYVATWDGRNDGGVQMASGMYFCRMEAGAYRQTRSMMLVK